MATRAIDAGERVLCEAAVALCVRDAFAAECCHACLRPCASAACSDACASALRPLAALSPAVSAAAAASRCDAELLRLLAASALAPASPRLPPPDADVPVVRCCASDVAALRPSPLPLCGAVSAGVARLSRLALASSPEPAVPPEPSAPPMTTPAADAFQAEHLTRLAAVLNGNAHGVGAGAGPDSGVGLFPLLSMLNHSCDPNCCFTSLPGVAATLQVRARRPIVAGEELCVSYVDLFAARSARREALEATKGFACGCNRCSAPLASSPDRFFEGALCTACGDVFCPPVVSEGACDTREPTSHAPHQNGGTVWACAGCGALEPRPGASSAACDAAAAELLRAAALPPRSRQHEAALSSFLSRFCGVLHDDHVLLMEARVPAMNAARRRGDAAGAAALASAVASSLRRRAGPCAESAAFYAAAAEAEEEAAAACGGGGSDAVAAAAAARKAAETRARHCWAAAAEQRRVCLGHDHPDTADAVERGQRRQR